MGVQHETDVWKRDDARPIVSIPCPMSDCPIQRIQGSCLGCGHAMQSAGGPPGPGTDCTASPTSYGLCGLCCVLWIVDCAYQSLHRPDRRLSILSLLGPWGPDTSRTRSHNALALRCTRQGVIAPHASTTVPARPSLLLGFCASHRLHHTKGGPIMDGYKTVCLPSPIPSV